MVHHNCMRSNRLPENITTAAERLDWVSSENRAIILPDKAPSSRAEKMPTSAFNAKGEKVNVAKMFDRRPNLILYLLHDRPGGFRGIFDIQGINAWRISFLTCGFH